MPETLIIRLNDSAVDKVCWARQVDATEQAAETFSGPLADAAPAALGCRVVVLVPCTEILTTSTSVPSRNLQKIAAAVPNLLEEQFATNIDELHFAMGRRNEDGQIAVAVVSREKMDSWLKQLHRAGIWPEVMVPDYLALPFREKVWSLLIEEGACRVRTATWAGFAVDADNLPLLLTGMVDESGESGPEQISLIECGRGEEDSASQGAMILPASLASLGLYIKVRSEERRVGKECRSRWSP